MYRLIRFRVQEAPQAQQKQFQAFVESCQDLSSATGIVTEDNPPFVDEVTAAPLVDSTSCLAGQKFVIAGSLQAFKTNQETLTATIQQHGGQVLKAETIPAGLPVDVIAITTQKECNKREK